MPGTEDDGHHLTVLILEGLDEVGHTLYPCLEQRGILPTGEHTPDDRGIRHIPCRTLRELLGPSATIGCRRHGVTGMPADGHNTTALHMSQQFVVDTGEGHTVKVLLVTHLDATQFKAHDSRIVAYGQLHIALAIFVGPADTIERIVLVSGHVTLLLNGIQTFFQQLSYCLVRLTLLGCASHHCQSN